MADTSYERTTQLVPAIAVLAPVTILVLVVFRTDDVANLTRSVVGVLAAAGFHLLAMRLVRDRGNKIQDRLWASWGGSTTVQRLQWATQPQSRVERLHRRIAQMTGVELPDAKSEIADPSAAEEIYTEAVARLREMTRDHDRYPRVWSELKQYGAARNMYGAKPAALIIAAVVVALSAAMTTASVLALWNVSWYMPALAGVLAVAISGAWLFVVTPSYVRIASERYSDALLAAPNEPGAVPQ